MSIQFRIIEYSEEASADSLPSAEVRACPFRLDCRRDDEDWQLYGRYAERERAEKAALRATRRYNRLIKERETWR